MEPGIDEEDLVQLLREVVVNKRCSGLTMTIFDPDLNPDGTHAARSISLLRRAFQDRCVGSMGEP